MFGKNQIKGQTAFRDADKLLVTSMFPTLQGEGPFQGHPAFFIRLAYCQLACSFCDTFFDAGDPYSVDEIMGEVDRRILDYYQGSVPAWADEFRSPKGDVLLRRQMVAVITGGEPMLQKMVTPLLHRLVHHFGSTQVESNGLLLQDIPETTVLVVSPKCSEKNGVVGDYLKPSERVLDRANYLKFVLSGDPLSKYHGIPTWALQWQEKTHGLIYVSPMNEYNRLPAAAAKLRQEKETGSLDERSTVDEVISFWEPGLLNMEANQRNHEYAARYAMRYGLRLSLQQHLYASMP